MAEATPDAEQIVRAHAEMWNTRDESKIPDVISEEYVEYNPVVPGGEIRGRDSFEEWMREIASAFPDFEAELLDTFADGETVSAEVRFTMTHEGEFNGVPPTGREVQFRGMGKFRVANGKVQELRNYFDTQALFDQLGITEDQLTAQADQPQTATTAAENERLALDYFDQAWNQGEINREVLADDFQVHTNLGGHEEYTAEEFETKISNVRAAMPDLQKEPDHVIATEDTVIIWYTMTGTQEGELKGIPPTGEDVEIAGVGMYRFDDGKLAEAWYVADFLRAMQQLGVVDSPDDQSDQAGPTTATVEQDNKAVMRRFFDAWNEADFETIEEVVADDAEQHNPVEPDVPAGPAGEKQLVEAYHSAFPDATLSIEDIIAEGDRVAVRYTATGTHEGEFMGIAPTGNDVEIVGYEIDQLADGQVVESWGLFDAFGLMEQLGVVERPGE